MSAERDALESAQAQLKDLEAHAITDEQLLLLAGHQHDGAQELRITAMRGETGHLDRAAARMEEPGQHLEGGGLPRAVGTEEAHALARSDAEGEAVDGLDRLVLALDQGSQRRGEAGRPRVHLVVLDEVLDANHARQSLSQLGTVPLGSRVELRWTMSAHTEILADVALFSLLDDAERAALAERLELVRFTAGQQIFAEGEPGASLYVVLDGSVDIFMRTTIGERVVLESATRGDFFGELSLLDEGPRTATALATTAVEALMLDREGLAAFLELRPAAALDLLAATARRLRENVRLLARTTSRNTNVEAAVETSTVLRIVDWISAVAGSLRFFVAHLVLFAAWIGLNAGPLAHTRIGGFDPMPFGLLTMAVSLEAIALACLLLLSSNRQAAHDRIRNDIEYDINLKAELEIAELHSKIDTLNAEVLRRLELLRVDSGKGR